MHDRLKVTVTHNQHGNFPATCLLMSETVGVKLTDWLAVQNLGKKERTQQFNGQIVATIKKHWVGLDRCLSDISERDIIDFAGKVNSFCPSRWNAIVSAMRSVTEKARILKRRRLRFREFQPPTKEQFARLLEECDKLPKSKAGLVVRLLSMTGLRFCELRKLRWENVQSDCLYITAAVSKSGKPRTVPFLPGLKEVLDGLKNDSEFVVPHPNFRRALVKACQRAGVGHFSYHSFRHLFITRCIQCGMDIPTLARIVGHQDGGSLLSKMYFHLCPEHAHAMVQKVVI